MIKIPLPKAIRYGFVLLFSFCFMINSLPVTFAKEMSLTYVKGDVELRVDEEWKRLEDTGVTIDPGTDLYVAEKSYAEVTVEDRDKIKINEKTALTIEDNEVDTTSIDMKLGSLKLDVKEKEQDTHSYTVRNPVAVVGVRGTEFSVFHEIKNKSEVAVNEGLVQVATTSARTRARKNEFVETRFNPETKSSQIHVRDEVPEIKSLVWKHWQKNRKVSRLQRKVRRIRAKLERIQERLSLPGVPRSIRRKLRKKRQRIDEMLTVTLSRKDKQKNLLEQIQSAYFAHREEITQERGDYGKRQLREFLGDRYGSGPAEAYKKEKGKSDEGEDIPYRRDSEPEEYPDF